MDVDIINAESVYEVFLVKGASTTGAPVTAPAEPPVTTSDTLTYKGKPVTAGDKDGRQY